MVTGINIPVRIGNALVVPGDVVLADREGMWFIQPHMVLATGKYTSRQIYGPLTPELQKERDEYVFKKTGRRPQPPRSQQSRQPS